MGPGFKGILSSALILYPVVVFFFDDPKPHDTMKVDIFVLLLKLGICLDVIVAFREIATKF